MSGVDVLGEGLESERPVVADGPLGHDPVEAGVGRAEVEVLGLVTIILLPV